jgi:hypothetical protein
MPEENTPTAPQPNKIEVFLNKVKTPVFWFASGYIVASLISWKNKRKVKI